MILRFFAAVLALVMAFPAAAQSFPVTISHAYGETTIPSAPQRIVVWGWSSGEAAIALGTVPVGMPTARSEGFDGDLPPWVLDAVAALGAQTPQLLDDSANPPIEQIASLRPDLILAIYSGITEAEYAQLSSIAPTVAFPEGPWQASWQQVIEITGEALGKTEAAQTMVADLEQFIADEGMSRPELAGTSFVTLLDYNDALAIHSADDARVKMLIGAGMTTPDKPEGAGDSAAFWYPMSYELFDQIPADVIIAFFSTQSASAAFLDKPFVSLGPWKDQGSLLVMDDRLLNMAIIPGNALSLRWGLPTYLDRIAAAARAAQQ